jgi:DNA primase
MARIPDAVIQRLKQEVSLQRLVEARGIELKRHGKDLLGLCPFHDDRSPSLVVTPESNLWNCLGACQQGGDVIKWVMKAQGVSFRHAVELLMADHPSLTAASAPVRMSTVRKLPSPIAPDASDAEALWQAVKYYHEALVNTPDAQAYLEKRGLRSSEMIGHFRLGFANRTLGLHLPPNNRKLGAELRGRLQKLGIIRDTGHEHFNGCIVFPIFDRAGQVAGIYGRKIADGHLREGTPVHLYLPGPHRGVWNEEALEASQEIILCESMIDALTFWCAGYRNVTASYGVNGFTGDHRAALKKYGTARVLIAYDRDEAGDKASGTLADELMGIGIECYRIVFPHHMDANEYGLKVQPASKTLGMLLNSAHWLGKGQPPRRVTVEIRTPPAEAEPIQAEESAAKEKIDEPDSSLAADVVPPAPALVKPVAAIPAEIRPQEVIITLDGRRYRVRGLAENTSYHLLKVNLMASGGNGFHVDTFNLYAAHQRAAFIKQAALEMGVKEQAVKDDFRTLLGKLEELQDEQIRQALEPAKTEIAMNDQERREALALLQDPKLMERILEDFAHCGLVGEEINKQVGYLAAVSRRLESPLAVVVQSSSAAGKSSLMDAILAFVPEEERVQFSAMTGQSLYYMGQTDLKHKVLAIVEEEGASRAAYPLKLLQSESVLSIASTGKDPATGKLVTRQYRVEGPVMMFLTTTAIDIDEELLNRCLVLTVSEEREQTQAIHRLQREAQTLEGLLKREDRRELVKLHQNAQRLLRPLVVVNPYAEGLTFPDALTRTRRDHLKYLTLIRTIALLYQHQRPVKTTERRGRTIEYIEAAESDIELANRLVEEVLGRSLDELQPQTRRLLLLIDEKVRGECERLRVEQKDFFFSRRNVRSWTQWGNTVLKKHLARLEEMEYLLVHRGGRGQSFVYELIFDGAAEDGRVVLPGLIDIQKLRYGGNRSRLEQDKAPSGRPQVAAVSRGGRPHEEPVNTGANGVFGIKRPNGVDTGNRGISGSAAVVGVER